MQCGPILPLETVPVHSYLSYIITIHNNTAGYNLAVSHFVRGHSPNCTFCDLLEIPEEHNETPLHLFFQCPAVETLTNSIFSWILNEQVEISRQELFTVFNRPDFRKNELLTIFAKLTIKFYRDCKQIFCLPNLNNAKTVLKSEIEVITHCNPKLKAMYCNSGIDLKGTVQRDGSGRN